MRTFATSGAPRDCEMGSHGSELDEPTLRNSFRITLFHHHQGVGSARSASNSFYINANLLHVASVFRRNVARDRDFHFRARSRPAPNLELRPNIRGALLHPQQPPVQIALRLER